MTASEIIIKRSVSENNAGDMAWKADKAAMQMQK